MSAPGAPPLPGVSVGQWTHPSGRTGCTVVLLPAGTVASVEVRGGAPASRELDLLAHTRFDGDALIAASAGALDASLDAVRVAATVAVDDAVRQRSGRSRGRVRRAIPLSTSSDAVTSSCVIPVQAVTHGSADRSAPAAPRRARPLR